ncbi:MAG: M1 family metallopeptidase [Ferruginibacter sp.]
MMATIKKMFRLLTALSILLLSIIHSHAQPLKPLQKFTHADTLRGTYGSSRDWWDVLKYDLHVKFNIPDSTISGYNEILYKVLHSGAPMQIDLQEPMIIDSVVQIFTDNKTHQLGLRKDGNAYFVLFPHPSTPLQPQKFKPYTAKVKVYFHGKPRIARRPPWDGGLIWKKSADGSPWVSVACQGLGASVWYPCKDHQSDEPDSAEMHITCPDTLMTVGNGRFRGKTNNGDGTATYDWAVTEPINNYNIIPYIGKYVHFGEVFKGEGGDVDMDYWVLEENLQKAKEHFADAPRMMKAFEYWFGPYPFRKDGYKLVDAPHLGMEHQSATAYGNKYLNGYLGRDQSGTGWGLKWDFIIVHESGHEWFANNVTSKDIADMWVHEGFTNYSETLFTDFWYGKQAGNEYCIGTRKGIRNDIPIIGTYNVNQEGSGDMYPKAGNMLHTIRNVIDNDEKFRQILRGLNKVFYHQTVTTQQVENYISKQSKTDFSKVFDQYLRTIMIPVLQYKIEGDKVSFRYDSCVAGFNLPVKVSFGKEDKSEQWIKPTSNWQSIEMPAWYDKKTFTVNPNFYIKSRKTD